jgi:hypothetical protein
MQDRDGKKDPDKAVDPDKMKITPLQAARLADATGLDAERFVEKQIGRVHEELKWRLPHELLLFRRVCGKVVRRNPASGELEPVPNATVHVEDTDCSFVFYSPPGWPSWTWLFPFGCKREVIATARTDECGRFCVWIPAWEIDWILRWRRGRLCFPTLWRPRVRDWLERVILPELLPEPPEVRPTHPPEATPIPLPIPKRLAKMPGSVAATPIEIPGGRPTDTASNLPLPLPGPGTASVLPLPIPDPARLTRLLDRPDVSQRLQEVAGPATAERIAGLAARTGLGAESERLEAELESPMIPVPPPLPEGDDGQATRKMLDVSLSDEMRERLGDVNMRHWIGPFWRCVDVVFGVWEQVHDVPDITFRVTQDIDADGTEEDIYAEGFFDVRWDAGAMSDVVLEADPSAISSPVCDGPEIDPGVCSGPTILTAGLMALQAPQFDTATGYAEHVNRARSGGTSSSPRDTATTAPFWSTVQLHGCFRFGGASYYRIMRRPGGSSTFVPVADETWYAPRLGPGAPIHMVPDADGWYPILPAGDLVFPHWLLNWRTWRYPNGLHEMKIELADGSKTKIDESGHVPFQIDNTRPHVVFTGLAWRHVGAGGWTTLPNACPVIRRTPGLDVEIRVSAEVSATHYRNALLFARACDGASLPRMDAGVLYDNWHTGPLDNAWSTTARFLVGHAMADGAYTIGINAQGRAFNPAGGDNGPSSGWDYDWVYSWSHPRKQIAIVDL